MRSKRGRQEVCSWKRAGGAGDRGGIAPLLGWWAIYA